MATKWVHVLVDEAVFRELQRVRSSMELAELMGLVELQRDPRDRVSLNQVIRRLVAFRDRHAERVRRSKARRRAARQKLLQDASTAADT